MCGSLKLAPLEKVRTTGPCALQEFRCRGCMAAYYSDAKFDKDPDRTKQLSFFSTALHHHNYCATHFVKRSKQSRLEYGTIRDFVTRCLPFLTYKSQHLPAIATEPAAVPQSSTPVTPIDRTRQVSQANNLTVRFSLSALLVVLLALVS